MRSPAPGTSQPCPYRAPDEPRALASAPGPRPKLTLGGVASLSVELVETARIGVVTLAPSDPIATLKGGRGRDSWSLIDAVLDLELSGVGSPGPGADDG